MRLSVFGVESLDSLESAVANAFSVIPPSFGEQLDFASHGLPLHSKDRSSSVLGRSRHCCLWIWATLRLHSISNLGFWGLGAQTCPRRTCRGW